MVGQRRILLLITDLEIGGTPTVVRELAVRLRPFAQVGVACLKGWGPVADDLRRAGVPVTALDAARVWHLPTVVRRLRRLVRESRVDTIFSFLVHANVVAALAAGGLAGVRLLQSIQTTQPRPRWHWAMQRWAAKRAERVVVPSPSTADVARRWSGVPDDAIEVIANAVDVSEVEPAPDSQPRRFADDAPFRIGFVGRLDPIKFVHHLIDPVRTLRSELGRAVTLEIYGDGPERGAIEAALTRAGLNEIASLHGFVRDIPAALRSLDCLVLPSAAEGFGLVLIEAMAAGVPVVATDVPGIRDVVRHEQTGLLVPFGSAGSLVESLGRLMDDGALRRRLVAAAWRDVGHRFSWAVVLPKYRALLGI